MNLRILEQRPPNYDVIVAAFPGCQANKPIFAYGDAIYNPFRIPVGRELVAHESVHCARQAGNPDAWWKSYIEDKQFRFTEELLAHQEEYRAYCDSAHVTRNQRRVILRGLAQRLASRLYGSLISVHDAKIAIAESGKPFRVRLDTPQ